MGSNHSFLGTGEIQIDRVNINGISASDAIGRLRTLESMVLVARFNGEKPEDLFKIAKYALVGNNDACEESKCYNLHVSNVDIYELSEKGLAARYEAITKQISAIIGIHSFLELARIALTGVPF